MKNHQAQPSALHAVPLPPMPLVDATLPPKTPFRVEVPEHTESIFQSTSSPEVKLPTQASDRVHVHIAPLWRHLCAGLVDMSIFIVLAIFVYSTYLWLHAPENLSLVHTTGLLDSYRMQALTWSLGLITLLSCLYNSFCALNNGQTLGRMLMGIVLIPETGKGLNPTQALRRSLLAPLSLFCLGAGYFWAIIDKKSRTWHDLASGTVAVYRRVSIPRR
ncbi:MAG: RDD family protein [Myxococcota bacterium]|jgi:uncharacterized RDD family membrane protein YckC|nr:RDD family protein [Myxococcota bacterium]